MGSNDQLINLSTRQTNLSGSNSSGSELNKQYTMSSNDPTESTFRAPKKKFIQLIGQEGGGRGGGHSVTHTGCGEAPLTAFLHETTGQDC